MQRESFPCILNSQSNAPLCIPTALLVFCRFSGEGKTFIASFMRYTRAPESSSFSDAAASSTPQKTKLPSPNPPGYQMPPGTGLSSIRLPSFARELLHWKRLLAEHIKATLLFFILFFLPFVFLAGEQFPSISSGCWISWRKNSFSQLGLVFFIFFESLQNVHLLSKQHR